MKMLRSLCLLVVILSFSCKKENAYRNNSVINTTPKSIIYQFYDTSIKNYVTFSSYQLYRDSNDIYFDSFVRTGFPYDATYAFNFSRYNNRKYLIPRSSPSSFYDSTAASIIQFDTLGRIIKTLDLYNLITESGGGGELFEFYLGYGNSLTGHPILNYADPHALSPSVRMTSLSFNVTNADDDSMLIESGWNESDPENPPTNYTVIFDSKENNTNLFALSGFGSPLDPQRSCNTFDDIRNIPLPKLNMKLAKAIYLTKSLEAPVPYQKMADFSYLFDDNNRVIQATFQYYEFDGSTSLFNNRRILFTY